MSTHPCRERWWQVWRRRHDWYTSITYRNRRGHEVTQRTPFWALQMLLAMFPGRCTTYCRRCGMGGAE